MVSAWREQLSARPAEPFAAIHHKSDAGQWALGLEVLPTELARDDEVIE
jgi:hypothetical protein